MLKQINKITLPMVALAFLGACVDETPEHPEELTEEFLSKNPDYLYENPDRYGEYFLLPKYGEPTEIKGQYWAHWERSSINLCSERRGCRVPRNVDGSEQSCWTVFVGEAATAMSAELKEGEYWIEGTGRIAVLPGSFGHLNQYTCQVEISEVETLFTQPCLTMSDEFVNRPDVVRSGICGGPTTTIVGQ